MTPPLEEALDEAAAMRRALELAARGVGRTAPNPAVGCVVLRHGAIVGEGWHPQAGQPHAEVFALRDAGELARGATLLVTLEPCNHHGRTPPCTEAVLQAGIRRVVAAVADPNPRVAGSGLARLREAGLEVECGLLEEEARRLNRGYFQVHARGRPWVVLKLAGSLDGRIATATGESRWVTGEAAREQVHRMRDQSDAVLIGSGTALADDPLLTARLPGARNPARLVVDSHARLPVTSRLAETARRIRTLLAVGPQAETSSLEAAGVEILRVPLRGERLDLAALMRMLPPLGLHTLLCEGGGGLAAALLTADLIDEVAWFVAPLLIGGDGAPALAALGVREMAAARRLDKVSWEQVGADLLLRGILRHCD